MKGTIKKKKVKNEENKTTIKAIIWDNWGVLVDAKCGSIAHVWSERLGAPVEDIIRVFTGPEHDQWHLDEIGKDEFYDYVIQDLGLPAEKKEVIESKSMGDFFYDKELLEYIKSLKSRFTVAMLTNFPRSSFEKGCNAWPELFEPFDHIIPSFEVNLIKPDPKIYQLTLERIGCKAQEAVFIDDTKEFVQAAQELGIHGILYKNREQAIEELESIISSNS